MIVCIYILGISVICYSLLIFSIIYGSFLKSKKKKRIKPVPVSVIIAIRNGESSLPNLIKDLSKQEYNGEMEFILVDDESEDNTKRIIKDYSINDKRFKYQTSKEGNNELSLKKKALDAGIKIAKFEWLLFTDVDCRISPSWIDNMSNYFYNENDYVIGNSEVHSNKSIVSIFQSTDYFLLMMSARGATNLNHAWACTGQNHAYRKSLYQKIGGFYKIRKQLQGDDSLFLNICKKWGDIKITFADVRECHVKARVESQWLSLLSQRTRWAGDILIMRKYNPEFFIIMLSYFFLHLGIIALFIITFFNKHLVGFLITILLIKFCVELLLYIVGKVQYLKKINFINFLIWFLIHIPYIVLMGISSFYANNLSWRGRKIKPVTRK